MTMVNSEVKCGCRGVLDERGRVNIVFVELVFDGASGDNGGRNFRGIVGGEVDVTKGSIRRYAKVSKTVRAIAMTICGDEVKTTWFVGREGLIVPKLVEVVCGGDFGSIIKVSAGSIKVMMTSGWCVLRVNDTVDLAVIVVEGATVVHGVKPRDNRGAGFTENPVSDVDITVIIRVGIGIGVIVCVQGNVCGREDIDGFDVKRSYIVTRGIRNVIRKKVGVNWVGSVSVVSVGICSRDVVAWCEFRCIIGWFGGGLEGERVLPHRGKGWVCLQKCQ
jgi:hypothetical protein